MRKWPEREVAPRPEPLLDKRLFSAEAGCSDGLGVLWWSLRIAASLYPERALLSLPVPDVYRRASAQNRCTSWGIYRWHERMEGPVW